MLAHSCMCEQAHVFTCMLLSSKHRNDGTKGPGAGGDILKRMLPYMKSHVKSLSVQCCGCLCLDSFTSLRSCVETERQVRGKCLEAQGPLVATPLDWTGIPGAVVHLSNTFPPSFVCCSPLLGLVQVMPPSLGWLLCCPGFWDGWTEETPLSSLQSVSVPRETWQLLPQVWRTLELLSCTFALSTWGILYFPSSIWHSLSSFVYFLKMAYHKHS